MSDVVIDDNKRKLDINSFQQLRIGLATADDIRNWSRGEVKKPETINYRTLRPERDGLFCEKIFGPTRDWECYCGKYKRVRFKGIICEKCGVEVTRSKVRRERMGHIELAAPVVHIWYLRGTRSWLAYLLGGLESREEIKAKQLEKVIYFAAWLVSEVNVDKRHEEMPDLEKEYLEDRELMVKQREKEIKLRQKDAEAELKQLEKDGAKESDIRARQKLIDKDIQMIGDRHTKDLDRLERAFETFQKLHPRMIIDDEELWREIKDRYEDYFTGGTGAEAIKVLIDTIDFDSEEVILRDAIMNGLNGKPLSTQRKQKAIKRLKIVASFNRRDSDARLVNNPKAMILDVIPVIPPELRPMVQLDGGRFATSDLNDLYRRVINRNNRLSRLLELGAPEIIVNNEKRMLQEAADALFDNGRRGRPVSGPGNRPLKSLSDGLKGKQGRFRQNLLGKRVDYSGRSVIVAGPTLRLQQCGLPKLMALELFKPFVMKRLADQQLAQNIKSAKKMVEKLQPEVWDVLEDVIKEHPVMLNRAPTLHRLGIQAFEPILVEGKAIKLHPLVCTAFNADFDGDQMAVHLPLSAEAQAEARSLMMASDNILKPADGHTVTMPSQDMILGLYYLTTVIDGAKGQGRVFSSLEEAEMALDKHEIDMQAKVLIRLPQDFVLPKDWEPGEVKVVDPEPGSPDVVKEERFHDGSVLFATSYGRILFNGTLPVDYPFVNEQAPKKRLSKIVDDIATRYSTAQVAVTLDALKDLGFTRAPWSGVSFAFSDVIQPPELDEYIEKYEGEADKVNENYEIGMLTEEERRQELVDLWTKCTSEVSEAVEEHFDSKNNLAIIVQSGARGNMMQINQIAGMRGLVANPKGEIIERPIKSNFMEGLSVLEYFISTHGARKGLADTALKTANSGYLTRRLVDVTQDLVVTEQDCGTHDGALMRAIVEGGEVIESLRDRILGRTAADDILHPENRSVLVLAGTMLDEDLIEEMELAGVDEVKVRTALNCETRFGICAKCYGRDLGRGGLVNGGEAVGVIAAQSIGEPGTQLTMRTFHIGGAASRAAVASSVDAKSNGVIGFNATMRYVTNSKGELVVISRSGEIIIHDEHGRERERHKVPYGAILTVKVGKAIKAGAILANWDPLTRPVITEFAGQTKFENVEEGLTVAKQLDEVTGLSTLVVIDPKRRGSTKVVRPQVKLIDAAGKEVKIPGTDHSVTIGFQIGSLIQVRDGQDVGPGEVLARIPVEGQKTRDITGGLPRVAELFEARSPKDKGMLAEMTGTVSFGKETKGKVRLQITDPDGKVWDELIPKEKNIVVHEGQVVNKGESVVDGPADPQDILRLLGMEELARYIVDEVQDVYRLQGVKINDKHIEVIVRQMLRRVVVENIGESNYISGEQVERSEILNTNDALRAEGKIPATFSNLLLGITKASLSTDSFISAASFQETTRVLTEAAIMGKRDELRGLKENVIVGRLIPAGTGLAYHKARAAKDAMDEAERRAITEAEAVELAEAQQLTEDAANAAESKA